MRRDPDVTARRRQLGSALATFRRAANLSQLELARRVHYDRTSITKIERGEQLPDRPFWQVVDAMLAAGGALLGGYDQLVHLVRRHAVKGRSAVLALHQAQAEQLRGAIRRPEPEYPSPPDLTVGWPGAVAHHGTPTEIMAIGALSAALRAADRQVGGGMLYASVVRYLSVEIGPRLVDASGPAEAALFSAACSLTELAGWMAHDGGNDAAAQRHFQRAYRLARAADDDALAANVCASMSHLAGELHQPATAVRIADAGIRRATGRPGTGHPVVVKSN